MIELTNVSYRYPNVSAEALTDINLQVAAGEFLLLAGPSGSGKSTLLRCVNGLVPHFSGGTISGKVAVNGIDAIAAGPRVLSREAGFVLQNPEAQAVLDQVEAEVAFALENAAMAPQEMRLRVEEVLDLLDLTPLRSRPLTTLSGGERQRVAIAAALALRPSILLLDEPTSQLDPKSAEDVLRSLVRLNEDLGLTVVLAEHRLERVLRYTDRVVYLEAGRVQVDDDVREAVAHVPQLPPLGQLARSLAWHPVPLTVKEGKRFARRIDVAAFQKKSPSAETPPIASPSLSIQDLHFRYNGQPTLNGIDLAVAPGEAVALMGRNGSGKSTLLKCVMGLLSAESGQVQLNGQATAGRSTAEIAREAAYLPQNPDDLLFAETVYEELAITRSNHGLDPDAGVADMLDELGISAEAQRYPRDLSVGQRQRVALGAVTVARPRVLLLDEPTRGLDYANKEALVALWRRWLAQGMGLLLVTHDVELVAQIADRVVILSQGEVIATGATAEVLGSSPLFASQIARLFPTTGWLTPDDALAALPH